jgi:hypothetical protein
MSIMPTHEEVREREVNQPVPIDHQAEQTRLLRSIRCYVAWAFWLAVAPAIAVALIYLAVLVAK